MSELKKVYDILLSSPNDVEKERELVTRNIEEINLLVNKFFNVGVRLIKWETNSHSTIGDSAQEIITQQFGSNFDIYVGIMGMRLGTPTKNSLSGTVDEFNHAHDIYLKNKSAFDIKFYFSDVEIRPSTINIEQYEMVREFKTKIQKLGVYTSDYNSYDKFARKIRIDIMHKIYDFVGLDRIQPSIIETKI